MTEQETRSKTQYTYDVVALHLLLQGEKSEQLRDHDGELGITCMYRGNYGLRCAIGFLISNQNYNPRMEGKGVGENIICYIGTEYYRNVRFLADLQLIHDNSQPVFWEEKLRSFAKLYGLDDSILELAKMKLEDMREYDTAKSN